MIRYVSGGRRHPRGATGGAEIFRWVVRGTSASVPATHRRAFHNIAYTDGGIVGGPNIFVWRSVGTTGTPVVSTGLRRMLVKVGL